MFMPGWLTWALKTLIAKSKPIQDIKTSVTESISVEAFLTPLKPKKKIKESDLIGCRYNLSIKWGKHAWIFCLKIHVVIIGSKNNSLFAKKLFSWTHGPYINCENYFSL